MNDSVHHLTTPDGVSVRVRPLRPTDSAYLIALYEHLSPASRATRFPPQGRQAPPDMVQAHALEISELQPPRGLGLIAFADLPGEANAVVGVVRYRLSPPDEAEVSISIRDDMQNRGLGAQLIHLIRGYARHNGIRLLFGLAHSDSRFMQWLQRNIGASLKLIPRGEFTYIACTIEDTEDSPPY